MYSHMIVDKKVMIWYEIGDSEGAASNVLKNVLSEGFYDRDALRQWSEWSELRRQFNSGDSLASMVVKLEAGS